MTDIPTLFLRYLPSGEIRSFGQVPPSQLNQQSRVGHLMLTGVRDVTFEQYVDVSGGPGTHVVVNRPVMPITIDKLSVISDGIDKLTITGLPSNATITLNERHSVDVTDGVFEYSTVVFGKISADIEAFPFLSEHLVFFGKDQ